MQNSLSPAYYRRQKSALRSTSITSSQPLREDYLGLSFATLTMERANHVTFARTFVQAFIGSRSVIVRRDDEALSTSGMLETGICWADWGSQVIQACILTI
jgi:hypothetical protein